MNKNIQFTTSRKLVESMVGLKVMVNAMLNFKIVFITNQTDVQLTHY